jgi:hypothetical protein
VAAGSGGAHKRDPLKALEIEVTELYARKSKKLEENMLRMKE